MKQTMSGSWMVPVFVTLALAVVMLPTTTVDAGCGGCGGCPKAAKATGGDEHDDGAKGCCGMARGKRHGMGHGEGAISGHGQGMGRQEMGHKGKGHQGRGYQGRGHGKAHHENIHGLLDRHDAIERTVEEIDGGVETVTTSDDPEVTRMLRAHVREMKQRVESGHGMRWWDPTFAELFRHHDKIVMTVEDVPGGVRVRETSADPAVALLIRQHAIRGVSEFVEMGRARAHQPTPLPEGYGTAATDPPAEAAPAETVPAEADTAAAREG